MVRPLGLLSEMVSLVCYYYPFPAPAPWVCTSALTASSCSVICLDEIADSAQVRPLNCRHIFHQECLDDWFARWNEYCPLCHRPIIPGTKEVAKKATEPPPIAFLV